MLRLSNPVGTPKAQESANLDLLRAVAVLFVLLDHTMRFAGFEQIGPLRMDWLGGLGVSFFFVHTSLVLMMSLERQRTNGFLRTAWVFYVRRNFRIYPLCWLVVGTTVLFHIPALNITRGVVHLSSPTPAQLGANLLLVQNVTFHRDVMGVLWSLPLEMQMYAVLPVLFLIAGRRRSGTLLLLWVIGVLAAIVQMTPTDIPGMARMSILRYTPCFLPGVLAYAMLRRRPLFPAWTWPLAIFMLSAVSVVRCRLETTWVICLCLGLLIPLFQEIRWRFVRLVSHRIATYSYGIYLTHVICIGLAFQTLRAPLALQIAGYCALVAGVRALLYHALEKPMIIFGRQVTRGGVRSHAGILETAAAQGSS